MREIVDLLSVDLIAESNQQIKQSINTQQSNTRQSQGRSPVVFRLRHEPDRDARHFFQRLDVDHRDVIRHRIRDVRGLSVRRERHPRGAFAAELHAADRLQIRQRVRIQVVVQTGCRRRASSDRRSRPCVRRIGAGRHRLLPLRQIGILDPVDFLLRREVDDRESVEAEKLNEDPLGRSVGFAENVIGRTPRSISSTHAV